ncbi:MAG: hypothetical protein RL616_2611, partial [Verrucomicrobiota bacterium]
MKKNSIIDSCFFGKAARMIFIGLSVWLGVACPTQAQDADAKLAEFFKTHLEATFQAQPMQATALGD